MDSLQALMDKARQHGIRMTRQRVIILQALCELGGHSGAEEVYQQATLHRRDVDRSTVYRTLERLRDLRILSQTDFGRGCAEFEIVSEKPHHHLVCQGCKRVIEVDHSYLGTAAESIRRDFGFEPIFDHFAIFGWCRKCWNGGDGRQGSSGEREPESIELGT